MASDEGRKGTDEATVGLVVRGRVQGVGFRWWSRGVVQGAGAAGFIWNHPDGTVRLVLRGRAPALARVREALGEGPPAARVEEVLEVPTDVSVDFDEVRIGAPPRSYSGSGPEGS